jgi:hypothetical protein
MTPIPLAVMQKGPNPLSPEDIEAAKALLVEGLSLNPAIEAELPGAVSGRIKGGAGGPAGKPGADDERTDHGGPADTVQPLNKRYEGANTDG